MTISNRRSSINASVDFCSWVLDLEVVTFGQERTAVCFGDREINLRVEDDPIARTPHPVPGIVDLCLVGDGTIDEGREHLASRALPAPFAVMAGVLESHETS